ncbi:cation/H+ exchanger 24 [Artemisia annua]|uniref:Cation/H+ exchanger 24 n=1 Tax=Artemisia annua TaxID=35608 RepID=A0A2U1P148_ARTAN|nr:cation/H+ exchanger 24 [Artemisia annua]
MEEPVSRGNDQKSDHTNGIRFAKQRWSKDVSIYSNSSANVNDPCPIKYSTSINDVFAILEPPTKPNHNQEHGEREPILINRVCYIDSEQQKRVELSSPALGRDDSSGRQMREVSAVQTIANKQIDRLENWCSTTLRDLDCILYALLATRLVAFQACIIERKLGINPILFEGLSSWSEHLEFGVIGDYVATVDFRHSASLLVLQQQV